MMDKKTDNIPPFMSNGNLPPGDYATSIEEVNKRFGGNKSLKRMGLLKCLNEFYGFIRYYSVSVYIDGSFTTSKLSPGDIDILVILGNGFRTNLDAQNKLATLMSKFQNKLHIFPRLEFAEATDINYYIQVFTHDKFDKSLKGIIHLES